MDYFLYIFLFLEFILQHKFSLCNAYCEGGYDPVCYFSDPEIISEEFHTIQEREEESFNTFFGNQLEQEDLLRNKRKSLKKKKKKKKKGNSLKKKSNHGQIEDNGQIIFKPLRNNEMAQEKIMTYPSPNKPLEVSYPPFTYNGLYPPTAWHLIPKWYFLPKSSTKKGKFTGMLMNDKSGISFMEFKSLRERALREESRQKNSSLKENNLLDSFDNFGGVSSINCSNSLFPSPLDVITKNANEDVNCVEFKFNNYDSVYSFVMFVPEDGTDLLFVKLQTPPKQISAKPSIENGATIGNTLYLDRILIHYGVDHKNGSEHRINGKSYGMELQFFFNLQDKTKTEQPYWNTLENYVIDNDEGQYGKNLLVLCLLVEVGEKGDRRASNKGLKYLSMAANAFVRPNNEEKFRAYSTKRKVLKMSDFFKGPQEGLYYAYYGSLTHPPCLNNTRYSVFQKAIFINYEDWRNFLFIPSEFSDTGFVAGNFRNMDVMTWNPKMEPFDDHAKVKNSQNIVKSRKSTEKERQAEYDYYEDNISTLKP